MPRAKTFSRFALILPDNNAPQRPVLPYNLATELCYMDMERFYFDDPVIRAEEGWDD